MSKRIYRQQQRARSAEATRQRIIDATRRCLTDAPLLAISMDRIAATAGVARRTIYTIFGSRAGLLRAIEQDLMVRGGFAEIQAAFEHADARQILQDALPASVWLFARERAILRALSLQALINPEAAAVSQHLDEGRIGGMRHLASLLIEQGHTRPELNQAEVADVLAVASDQTVQDRLMGILGLSPDDALQRLRLLVSGILRAP